MAAPAQVIGVLSIGELGEIFCRSLARRGHRVVTSVQGRSPATRARAERAGAQVLATPADVAREADWVVSLVPPARAAALAEEMAPALAAHPGPKTFVDANSISPDTAVEIERIITAAGVRFVDAAVFTLPRSLSPRMYASGTWAGALAALDAHDFRILAVGDKVGTASLLKMCYSFQTKATLAVWLVMLAAAEHFGLEEELAAELELGNEPVCQSEVWKRVRPLLHENRLSGRAGRWVGEMQESEKAFQEFALAVPLIAATKDVFAALADASASGLPSEDDARRLARHVREHSGRDG